MRFFLNFFDSLFPENLFSLLFFGEPEYPDKDLAA